MRTLFQLSLIFALSGAAQGSQSLPRSAPEAQGISSAALHDFVQALDQIQGLHGVVVVRHGHVVAEGWWKPYEAARPHVLYSLSKSFTSTAVGFAVAEGKVSLDDEVLKFFPEDAPSQPSANLKSMRVRDLLMMSTGHQDEPPFGPDQMTAKSFLSHPVPHLPGAHFRYNTPATFMLSAIVQKATGETVLEYLKPRLFAPLGMEDPVWDANPQGITLGGYGLRARTEDVAKFGLLYLQHGRWNGRQLLPTEWVAMATARQTSNGSDPNSDWSQGYGFQFWRCRHDAFRGDGAFGQYCVVMPEQDTVVAINSGLGDMQPVLNLIWDKLLPAMQSEPLPANPDGANRLNRLCTNLAVSPAQGAKTSPLAARILNRKWVLSANEQQLKSVMVSGAESGQALTLTFEKDGKTMAIPCGHGEWKEGRGPVFAGRLGQFPDEPLAGTYAWRTETQCVFKVCAVETPYQMTVTIDFSEDRAVAVDVEFNVSFGPTKWPRMTAH